MYRWQRSPVGRALEDHDERGHGPRPDVETPTGQSQAIPPAIARIEDDGDGSGRGSTAHRARLCGRRRPATAEDGRQRQRLRRHRHPAPSSALGWGRRGGRAADEGRDWVDAILPSLERSSERTGGAAAAVRQGAWQAPGARSLPRDRRRRDDRGAGRRDLGGAARGQRRARRPAGIARDISPTTPGPAGRWCAAARTPSASCPARMAGSARGWHSISS